MSDSKLGSVQPWKMPAVYLLDLTRHMTVMSYCLHFTNSRESRQKCMRGHSLTSLMAPPEQRMNQVWKQLRAKWQWPLECVSVFLHASTSGARIWRGSRRSYTPSMGEHYEFNYYVRDDLFVIMPVQCIVYSYCVLQVDRYGCGTADRSNPSSAIQRMVCLETQLFRYIAIPGLNRPVPKAHNLILRRLMSYIYAAPILDVSRSHTTTQHSR